MEAVIRANAHHFRQLESIIRSHPEPGYVAEGCIWFEAGSDMGPSARFEHKRHNLFSLASRAGRILEIGFNAGHSCLLMLLANPESRIQAFDLGSHAYTRPCFEYLSRRFPGRISLECGDSTLTVPAYGRDHPDAKFDLLHIDGGHEEIVLVKDVHNCRWLADPAGHVVVVDDDNLPHINWWNRAWRISGFFADSCGVPSELPMMSRPGGGMDHYVASYSFRRPKKALVVAHHAGDLAWLDAVPADVDVVTYSKYSIPPNVKPGHVAKVLARNVGMDQASHLSFIVDHYDALPETVLFAQDDMDVHVGEAVDIYNNTRPSSAKEDIGSRIREMFEEALSSGSHSNNAFAYGPEQFGEFAPHYGFKVPARYCVGSGGLEEPIDETFGEWFESSLKREYPRTPDFLWFKNSIFAVHRDRILSRPKSDYVDLLAQFCCERGELDHFVERAWYYILNLDSR